MQITLNKVYPLDASAERAWAQLKDIEQVAGCMPGAEITEKTDESHYKGKVKVKIGPMNVAFDGTITVENIDPDAYQIHLIAAGQDSKGSSSANMDLKASVKSNGDSNTELSGDAVVTVNGKLANFGGRMMTQVADQILQQFADNFSAKLAHTGQNTSTEASLPEGNEANEINGLKIAWAAFIGWLKSFFGPAR